MAEVVRYVNTASSAGGDGTTNGEAGATRAYASLNEWEANEQTDLVTDTDTHVVNCGVGSGSAADTTAVNITGWTTGASNFITIKANPSDTGGDQRAVMPFSSSIYRLFANDPVSAGELLTITEDYTVVESLQIRAYTTSRSLTYYVPIYVRGDGVLIDSCLIRTEYDNALDGTATRFDCIRSNTADAIQDLTVVNTVISHENLAAGDVWGWWGIIARDDDDDGWVVYNCTAYSDNATDHNKGFWKRASPVSASTHYLAKNCLADTGTATTALGFQTSGSWATGTDYNASADATAPGGNSRTSQTFTFVDAAGGDYHLDSQDAGARGYGADLSGDATYAFSDDFDGDNRLSEVWDIGADQTPILVGGTHVVLTAPAVVEGAAGQSRTVDVASLITWSPAVTATGGGASATIDSAGLIAHAPAATVSAIISATVAAPQAVIYAPEVTRQAGAVSRAADGAPVILHAPELTAGFGQTVVIGSALWICVAPGVFQRIEAEPPLRVVADSTTTYVKVRHGGVWV